MRCDLSRSRFLGEDIEMGLKLVGPFTPEQADLLHQLALAMKTGAYYKLSFEPEPELEKEKNDRE